MILTNSLSDVSSKLRSCYHVFQIMFLFFSFLHPTENLIQCPFQQAGVLLFFRLSYFCLISNCRYVLINFRHDFHPKAFHSSHDPFQQFLVMPIEVISQGYSNVCKISFEVSAIFFHHQFFLNMLVLCFVSASCLVSLFVL